MKRCWRNWCSASAFRVVRLEVFYFLAIILLYAAPVDAADNHTSIFTPFSTPAEEVYANAILVLAICVGIFLTVGGFLVYTIIRFRQRPDDDGQEPPQVYGSKQIELAWTVIPLVIVFVLLLVTARTIANVQNVARPRSALNVTVVGHQWWWEIRYPDFGVVTANELHVPVSEPTKRRPTFLTLESADVAHSFWVPQLAGKTDLIPNRKNIMWIEPKQPGVYVGNCAEYCGVQHAHMLLRVIAQPADAFEQWIQAQQRPAVETTGARGGRNVFFSTSCVKCHAINGTQANGKFGPNLTHLMSRETLAAGVVANTPEHLRAWVRDPQAIKEGSLMPDMQLSNEELDQVVAYLSTLK